MCLPRWLCQRSRHCLPERPNTENSDARYSSMVAQLRVPWVLTSTLIAASSSMVHTRRLQQEDVPELRAAKGRVYRYEHIFCLWFKRGGGQLRADIFSYGLKLTCRWTGGLFCIFCYVFYAAERCLWCLACLLHFVLFHSLRVEFVEKRIWYGR